MSNYEQINRLKAKINDIQKMLFVLSGFAAHLASHFGRSFENHSYGYACSNDRPLDRSPGVVEHMDVRERPNCLASYTAKSGSFVQYAG
jgi:hypothetical protein